MVETVNANAKKSENAKCTFAHSVATFEKKKLYSLKTALCCAMFCSFPTILQEI